MRKNILGVKLELSLYVRRHIMFYIYFFPCFKMDIIVNFLFNDYLGFGGGMDRRDRSSDRGPGGGRGGGFRSGPPMKGNILSYVCLIPDFRILFSEFVLFDSS